MAPPLVLPLSRCTDPSLVGGKAAGLARLLAAGLPVPDGCCLTTGAYQQSLQAIGFVPSERWRRAATRTGDARRRELQDCREIIRRIKPGQFEAAIAEELDRIRCTAEPRFALRSSATNEDMAHASAAGLYRTVLAVEWTDVGGGIIDVWASLWDERVMDYMARSGLIGEPPAMAVVIQPLVDARIAGVAHSVHPVTGRAGHVTINAVHGLGQPLVDGKVSPHEYVVDIQIPRVITRLAGLQFERLVATPGGLAMEPIASADRDRPLLSDPQLFEVAAATKRIEQAFHTPVDVEWAVDSERLWILQARPLTGSPTTFDMTNEDCEWSRANFKETMPELPSPMGLSFLERFMDAYIVSHYRRLGCRIPPGVSSVRVYAGRPYLNVTLFHVLVGQLGGDPALNAEQMGGDPVQSAPSVRPLAWWALLRAGWLMWREMRRVLTRSAASFAGMKALASRYTREHAGHLSLTDARSRLDELGRWLDVREVTFGIAAGAGQCLQVFSRILPKWLGADWRRLLNESLQGQGTVISAQHILKIAGLVTLAREDAAVSDAFRHGWEPGDYRRNFSGSRFLAAFDRYLDDYGHRAVGESDIMSPRLSDHPEAVLGVIKTQLNGASATPEQLIVRQQATRKDALATIRTRCGWRLDRWLIFRWWYRRLCRFFTLREANRHHLMWYSQAARHLLLRVGKLLVDQGLFNQPDDIFFLTLTEVEHLDCPPPDTWPSLIRTRRRERERWSTVEVPDVIRNAEHPQPPSCEPPADSDRVLRGLPLSSGIVSGPARFVRVAEDWSRVRRGDIIVAPVIDPGMAPLFGIAGGLIVEMGGTLSHGAIIAREYGLPTIANVPRAMLLLSEDEHITMDASNGTVRRHNAP